MTEFNKNGDSIRIQIEKSQSNLGIRSPDDLEIDLSELTTRQQTTEFIREKVAHLEGDQRTAAKHYVEGVIAQMRQDEQNAEKT